jgi:hypothetical protein
MGGKIVIEKGQITDGYGRVKSVGALSADLHASEQVFARHGWYHVSAKSMLRFYASAAHTKDRIQLLNGVWSHRRCQGGNWLVAPQGKGNNPEVLDTYLRVHFRPTE